MTRSDQAHSGGPVVVEIAGRPYSGKTTLAHKLKRSRIGCDVIEEVWPHFPEPAWKQRWEFSAWAMTKTISAMVERSATSNSSILVLDKGLVDVQCWIEWFRMRGNIEDQVADVLRACSQIHAWYGRLDVVLVLDASCATAVQRRGGDGLFVNDTTFEELALAYNRVLSDVPVDVEYLSTDHVSPDDALAWARSIIDRLRSERTATCR